MMRRSIGCRTLGVLLVFGSVCGVRTEAETAPPTRADTADTSATTAAAATEESELDEIVVTATRTPQTLADVPASVSVVTRSDIERQPAVQSVDEMLRSLPGVYDRRGRGLTDMMTSVSLRGLPGDARNLTLVDGSPINDGYSGGVTWAGLSTDDIERIEVVRGPTSSLYGGHAMGGVISIINRLPRGRERRIKAGYGSAWDGENGSGDLFHYYISGADTLTTRLRYMASYGYRATDGYRSDQVISSIRPSDTMYTGWTPTTSNTGAARYLIGNRGMNGWWDDSLRFAVGLDLSSQTELVASYTRTRGEYSYTSPQTYIRDTAGRSVWTYRTGASTFREASFQASGGGREKDIARFGITTAFGDMQVKANAGLLEERSWHVTPNSTTSTCTGGPGERTRTPSSSYNVDLQFIAPLGDRHLLTFGGNWQRKKASTGAQTMTDWRDLSSTTNVTYRAGGRSDAYGVFLQDEFRFTDRLALHLGGRMDWSRAYDGNAWPVDTAGSTANYTAKTVSAFSPKAAVVWQARPWMTLRSSIGKAFRPPSVYDLYRTWRSTSGITYQGNPELKPEHSLSWDIGGEVRPWSGGLLGVTCFNNELKDMIYRLGVPATTRINQNVGRARSEGIEAEIEQKLGRDWRLFANYTWTQAKITEFAPNPSLVGKRLTGLPERIFNGGLDWTRGAWSANVTAHYVGKRLANDDNSDWVNGVFTSFDPYWQVDSRLNWQVTEATRLSVTVTNLLDCDYYFYYPAPGRSYYAEFEYRF
jgi:iron complex outermembrane receptor protein